jgi:hypothetical protein
MQDGFDKQTVGSPKVYMSLAVCHVTPTHLFQVQANILPPNPTLISSL